MFLEFGDDDDCEVDEVVHEHDRDAGGEEHQCGDGEGVDVLLAVLRLGGEQVQLRQILAEARVEITTRFRLHSKAKHTITYMIHGTCTHKWYYMCACVCPRGSLSVCTRVCAPKCTYGMTATAIKHRVTYVNMNAWMHTYLYTYLHTYLGFSDYFRTIDFVCVLIFLSHPDNEEGRNQHTKRAEKGKNAATVLLPSK